MFLKITAALPVVLNNLCSMRRRRPVLPRDRRRAVKLKEVRVGAGIGREKAARLAGMDRAGLYKIETGKRVPGIEVATRIARSLAVNLSEIDEFAPALAKAQAAGLVIYDEA